MTKTIYRNVALLTLLFVISGPVSAEVVVDGVYNSLDTYSHSKEINWFNGHSTKTSIYNDQPTTTIYYEYDNDNFFLYVEAPLYAKNMIWQNLDWKNIYPVPNTDPLIGLTEEDVASYRTQHETHHRVGDMKLDFGGATGSEKMELFDRNGNLLFTANLAGDADNAFGLVQDGFMDSVDYLIDNGLATEDLSLNRETPMSFEFKFGRSESNALLGHIEDPNGGIEASFHMSPERGLTMPEPVPEPATMLMLAAGIPLLAERRKKRAMK
ncbi:MAG: PEP-CTERM sorting domain-containing protein [Phycisphaerales bacterium]|nr:PEP-CTERM sorting domain-containing protein [Phycisphaerales bacterium]